MDELTLDDKKYLSSKRAAQVTGYAKDYVGQLAREGRVEARLVGRNWYILESSILEHRFGAEEETPVTATPEELSTTWETPKYIAESPTQIPELAPKPVVQVQMPAQVNFEPSESRQVLEDMQAAWKEWFDSQPKKLPDADEMLLDDHEVGHFEIKPIRNTSQVVETPEEAPEVVHIERHSEPEPHIVQRSIEEIVPTGATPVTLNATRAGKRSLKPQRRTRVRAGRNILRAIFIGVAVIAVTITLIGSGSLEGFKTRSFITDFFSGTKEVSK